MDVVAQRELPADWGALAGRRGTFYHDPHWIEGIAACFDFPLHVLVARDAGALVGGLALAEVPRLLGPRRLVSFPFSYAAGVLAETPAVVEPLYEAAVELALRTGAKRVEVKTRADIPLAPHFERTTRYSTYRVPTDGGERGVWKRLNVSSTQRGIKKGASSGLVVSTSGEDDDWRAMVRLEQETARRLGSPAPPARFFLSFARGLQPLGLAQLYVARTAAGEVAAGIVVWKGTREWIYAFGASEPAHLPLRPNHVLLWQALREATAASVTFDLGRAAPEQEGLVQFKQRWGGEAVPLRYDYWPRAGGVNVARRDAGGVGLASRVWSHLPAWVARQGSRLYRYLG